MERHGRPIVRGGRRLRDTEERGRRRKTIHRWAQIYTDKIIGMKTLLFLLCVTVSLW
jgi:hypothetical protein